MTTIGFIGSGRIGGALAHLAVAAGHDIVLSNSRGQQSLQETVALLGSRARAATPAEAAAAGDVVVVTIPVRAYRQVPVDRLRGRIVIDTLNYDPERQGAVPEIEASGTPPHLLLQAHLPDAQVVKAFSTVFFKHLPQLTRPPGAPDRSAVPIAGDHPTAKTAVAALIDSLGFDAYDAGPLAESRRFAPGTPAQLAYLDPDGMFAAPARPASAADLAALLDKANRP
ncbi:NADPH-dependent F420 reductase [Actinoplanes friuliensis]|uniref:Coenzyme F420-dependent NADP oxidoreductase n=1 Tax=Actinoplanes friuliensis DSM 7358 TaxID=1246995 RepID=U5W846_9ACTN|nr:NAD(P)-binding domain-containing protein [Actinoplanes friuliensis]AGZ44091.1 coenzyme F420-dependent NADP oxidoreductase [Actinoplanes friuliensis DSM 7358]